MEMDKGIGYALNICTSLVGLVMVIFSDEGLFIFTAKSILDGLIVTPDAFIDTAAKSKNSIIILFAKRII